MKDPTERSGFRIALPFILPNFLGFLVFTLGPVLFSLGASFTNWNLKSSPPLHWVGLKNFFDLTGDQDFWLSSINTVYFLLGLPVAVAGSLFLAILLNQRLKGITIFRTLFYLPSFTSGVAIMILWKALYNPSFGPINVGLRASLDALGMIHTDTPQWLLSTKNLLALNVESVGVQSSQFGFGARDALVLMGVWTAVGGNNMLLYLAALTNVPEELTEAAQLDGAGRWKVFRNVIWPQLAPTTFFIVVMSFIGGLQGGFEQARVMTNGGPAGTTTTLAYMIYQKAFVELQIGYASAISWVLFAVTLLITACMWKFGNQGGAE